MPPRVSVLIPAFNEERTIAEVVRRAAVSGRAAEIVVVDDGSCDETERHVRELALRSPVPLRLERHATNCGKGAAIRTGLAVVTGDVVLIQDADLEYDPMDYPVLLEPFSQPAVQAVFGSRNLCRNPKSSSAFYWGGRYLSWFTNLLYGSRLSDVTTGYKVVRTDVLRGLALREDGFDFCVELAARLLRRNIPIHEVPISYRPRSRAEGKKIRARDGLRASWTLVKLRWRKLAP